MRDGSFSDDVDEVQVDAQRAADVGQRVANLRILATTDVHMQLLGFDYVQDRPIDHAGLAGLATLIAQARAEAAAEGTPTLLLDNGDFLQGNAIGTHLAQVPVTPAHPVVACLRHLAYDALGLGNHDLDHGLSYLCDVARVLPFPTICSNLVLHDTRALVQSALLTRRLAPDRNGIAASLRIGVLSVLPEQTAHLNRAVLKDRAQIAPARDSVLKHARLMRSRGADVVILLAHMGIEGPDPAHHYRDDARALAALPGIDALVTGHTHRRLPGQDHAGYAGVDERKGGLHLRPAVMPGFDASDLAVLDLDLVREGSGGWYVAGHRTELRANTADVPPDPVISAICRPAHLAVRESLSRACGHTDLLIHNFFSLAKPTRTCALVACAKHDIVARGLAGTEHEALPILAAASAHTAGGRGGPANFLQIAPGPVLLRHLAGFSPYENTFCALKVTGGQLRGLLENTACVYTHLSPDLPDQDLVRSDRPTFDFDTIYGLNYVIDPTRPVGQRIVSLSHQGREVTADQPFVLATTEFRAAGGGGGTAFRESDVLYRSSENLMTVLASIISGAEFSFSIDALPWRLRTPKPVRAILRTSPEALAHLRDIAHLNPAPSGQDADGFARIALHL